MQLCSSLSILWHCLSLELEWKLTFSSPVATAEFSKFDDILSAGEWFQFFSIENNVSCGFLTYGFYYVEVCSFCACFLEGFCHKWVLNFVKGFLCIYWDNHMVLSSSLLIWHITLIDLLILKNPCIPRIKPTWSWCMIFLVCWGFCLLKSYWGFLHLCLSVILLFGFLFLW